NVGPGPGADGPQGAFYREHVKPILSANCYRCHAGFNHRGAFRMDSRGALLRGGTDGAVVVPGRPEDSLLVKLVRHEGPANHPMPMPPKKKLSDPDIAAITQWVRDGVTMPDEPK
ncbi:MAG TPA: c-type cytochrome domain-containing protein, partial [Acidobacteriaceae bacterium]|nr:c-type cytochrome domain-containing protein [Acidobacteriaceae bacterium]